ncbi:hypothetical protein E4633_03695 [Geomonas terrae]|uniref:PD(D/E)XK endonuclease domain-containing protein n=1 Tax=Geomonas terrae TaxID=2562681 RepID=A0A4S1CLD2_9BACT|nr:hypothetical protein [Geomonas terrae]TGU74578.1 hypothetical protein E4633_03695 [Geomonas terrae]
MTDSEKTLMRAFFHSAEKLYEANIVRSDKLLGDIGEWLCVKRYGLVLEQSGRHPGYDGLIGNRRVQVKVHNSPEGTNLNVGDPEKYDELIVILGPRSRLRPGSRSFTFHFYRFTAAEVEADMKRSSGYYCAKTVLAGKEYEHVDI